MKLNFKEIFEGWRNDLLPPAELKETIERVRQERMLICQGCEFNSNLARQLHGYTSIRTDYHCTECGCPLKKKTACLSCSCPLNKWLAEVTEEEDDKISEQINN